jgi:hypothetical protein
VDFNPAVPQDRQDLATHHTSLGILLQTTGRRQDAEGAYQNVPAIRKELAAVFPTGSHYESGVNLMSLDSHNQKARKLSLSYG